MDVHFDWKLTSIAENGDDGLLLEFSQVRWFKVVGGESIECDMDDPDATGRSASNCMMLVRAPLEMLDAGFQVGKTYRCSF